MSRAIGYARAFKFLSELAAVQDIKPSNMKESTDPPNPCNTACMTNPTLLKSSNQPLQRAPKKPSAKNRASSAFLLPKTPTHLTKEKVFDAADAIVQIAQRGSLSHSEIAQLVGASLASVVRWARDDSQPSPDMAAKIETLWQTISSGEKPHLKTAHASHTFASRGNRKAVSDVPLFRHMCPVNLTESAQLPLIKRLKQSEFWGDGEQILRTVLSESNASPTLNTPPLGGISAGKNTYTYDAHTYHTKVPPQGIAEVIKQYLPEGGVVLDPFSGSGMTGVAAKALGYDVILNELSPAASFISDRFTRSFSPKTFADGVAVICEATDQTRKALYSTDCRECGKQVELLYTVWSYRVKCNECSHDFILWDHCRKYGLTVREHKILSEFPCPCCHKIIKKSRLERSYPVAVLVGYRCCSRRQVEHAPNEADLRRIGMIDRELPFAEGFFPTTAIPDGVNLCQPKRHGITSIDKFYTNRNLVAMSHLWRAIHHIGDAELAGFLGFAFTSLYQRVTRLSEFRFWGGSGNTAHFNVPYVFNEANVFVTFERKARSIQDHLETTACCYSGQSVVRTGSATRLDFIPDNSVDLIFTDPPFGANINYSEMNILWEAWLGSFTDNRDEVIVNRFQSKDPLAYGDLMRASLSECCRVLRSGHWLVLVFMNSSQHIWNQLRRAISAAGFDVERVDIFDKQHGTFKQFVSDNTAGCDLILHCRKPLATKKARVSKQKALLTPQASIAEFLTRRRERIPMLPYLHVERAEEIDFRRLYSEWLAGRLFEDIQFLDFSSFIEYAKCVLATDQ
jgi:DNA modification methylase/DNA-binding transcriptional regulator YiaG